MHSRINFCLFINLCCSSCDHFNNSINKQQQHHDLAKHTNKIESEEEAKIKENSLIFKCKFNREEYKERKFLRGYIS